MCEQDELFVGREKELSFLREAYESDRAEMVIVYGRRRVGKTEMVKRSLSGLKSVYFLAEHGIEKENRTKFKKLVSENLDKPLMEKADLSWEEIFDYLGKEDVVVVIDEFPHLIASYKAIPSIFQKIWDENIRKTGVKIVLLGSSVSIMETDVLGYRSPLYGRRTGQIRLKPLEFIHMKDFFPDKEWEDLVRIYGITDGIPSYINEVRYLLGHDKNLTDVFLPNRPLFEEAEFLIRTELREPGKYFHILKAVAFSKTKFGDIVNFTGMPSSTVSQYLSNLRTLHIVKEEHPYGEKEANRNARYYLTDNYFAFYFKFIYEYKSQLMMAGRIPDFEEKYNQYLGGVFEKIGLELVKDLIRRGEIDALDAGRWWHKEDEIDMVATGNENVYFFETKWSSLDSKDADRIVSRLREKSERFKHNGERRYGIFAKQLKSKKKLRENGILAYDLQDLQHFTTQR